MIISFFFRMSFYKVQIYDIKCPVCHLIINGITRSGRNSCVAHYVKTTSCCGKLKTLHHNCAIRFLSKSDSTYEFDLKIYEGDNKIKSICMKSSKKTL